MNITINDVLYAVLTVCLPYFLKLLLDYITIRAAETKYSQAVKAVADAVSATNQTYVDALKKAGKFDKQSQEIARQMAVRTATTLMSDTTKAFLNKNCGDLEQWIFAQIEANKGRESHEQASGIVSAD